MGRELRMVPVDWQHPTQETAWGSSYRPLYRPGFAQAAAEWDEEAAQWADGFRRSYGGTEKWEPRDETHARSYEDWAGARPRVEDYMPDWPAEQRTHFMMYEDTSEGTPISPAFETAEELARWLANTGASAFGGMTASYDAWLSTIKRGFACSMVMQGGKLESGVEALANSPSPSQESSRG